nr:group IID secretory phospholipase A2 isoform X1 [Manis javanica]
MEHPLLCMLMMFAGVIPTQGGILNLNKMVEQVTRKTPIFSYWPYGCHCGLGGKGQPKDATDWCCHAHDCCYDHLKHHQCRVLTDNYNYTFSQGHIQCYNETEAPWPPLPQNPCTGCRLCREHCPSSTPALLAGQAPRWQLPRLLILSQVPLLYRPAVPASLLAASYHSLCTGFRGSQISAAASAGM